MEPTPPQRPPASSAAFTAAVGPVPARGEDARWRQVALLSAARALGGAPQGALDLAALLAGFDHPHAAADALGAADPADPWTLWWRVITAGQSGDLGPLAGAEARFGELRDGPPDAREVGRRLADLTDEVAAMAGRPSGDRARFAVLGHRARPVRRMLLGGRSSATFLVDPGWDSLHLIRLGPAAGAAVGNRAMLGPAEMLGAVRRGDAGPGWDVPEDTAPVIAPERLLDALREDVGARDRRLVELAREVADERQRLREERAAVAEERERLDIEAAAARRRARPAPARPADPERPEAMAAPRTRAEALSLLGLTAAAGADQVERAWREQVVRCHPDRVAGMHPAIRSRAAGLTVALNQARDLLLGAGTARRR